MNRKTMPQLWIVVVAILLVGLLVCSASAETVILPGESRVVSFYDFNETHQIWDGLMYSVASYVYAGKELFYLDGGLLTIIEETTPAIGISGNIPNLLSLIPGINMNIGETVTFGGAVSYNFRDGHWMSGLYISLKLG